MFAKYYSFTQLPSQDALMEGMALNECNCSHQTIGPAALRVIESFKLEKTLEIIKSNCKPSTVKSSRTTTKPK